MLKKSKKKNVSEIRIRKEKEFLLKEIENKSKYGDYIIVKYIRYQKVGEKKGETPGHVLKIKCLKCGYEKIISSYNLKALKSTNSFYCFMNSKDKNYKCSNQELKTWFGSKYMLRWIGMNRQVINTNLKEGKSKLPLKGIKICEEWRFCDRNGGHRFSQINNERYHNYEKFIDNLLKSFGYTSEDLENRSIRIDRIDKNNDFEPSNIGIKVKGIKQMLIPKDYTKLI